MKKNTKKSLLFSVLALILCTAMLLGTTFAWFTDTKTTGVNKIQAGTLKIDLQDADGASLVGSTLSFHDKNNDTNILWEPGATFETKQFKVVSTGSLALKYKIELNGTNVSDNALMEVIKLKIVDANGDEILLNNFEGHLTPSSASSGLMKITATMDTTAGNKYQGMSWNGISITVYATQDAFENDINGNTYDENAEYGGKVVTVGTVDEFLTAFANLKKNDVITLTQDIDMTGKTWTPVRNLGFTLDGNGKTITGMNGPLVATTAAQNYTIKDITFDGLTIDNLNSDLQTAGLRCAALIAYADTCSYIMMENVTIQNADIKSADYAAGFAADTSGYGVDNNGPVNASHNFTNCKLLNSTIHGVGSTGGLIGHAGSNNATTTRIKDFTATGNTITNDEGAAKVGNMIATANVGTVYIDDSDITAEDIGRFVPYTTGKLYINDVEQDAQNPFTNIKTN